METCARGRRSAENGRILIRADREGMTFDKATNKLTLTGVSPVTLFFTDRPERIAGNMKTRVLHLVLE